MGGESTPQTKEDHLQAVNSNIKRTSQPSHWLINGKNNMGPGGGGEEGGRGEGKCKIQRLNKTQWLPSMQYKADRLLTD